MKVGCAFNTKHVEEKYVCFKDCHGGDGGSDSNGGLCWRCAASYTHVVQCDTRSTNRHGGAAAGLYGNTHADQHVHAITDARAYPVANPLRQRRGCDRLRRCKK